LEYLRAGIPATAKRRYGVRRLDSALSREGAGAPCGGVGHLFGDRQADAQNTVSQASGLDSSSTAQLLMMLAPIVMGALGRARQQSEVDEGSLGTVLDGAARQTASNSPMLDMLTNMLDRNRDGSAVDDVVKFAGNLFGRRGA